MLLGDVKSDVEEERMRWSAFPLLTKTSLHWLLSTSHFNFLFERDQTIRSTPRLFYFLWGLDIAGYSGYSWLPSSPPSVAALFLANAFIWSFDVVLSVSLKKPSFFLNCSWAKVLWGLTCIKSYFFSVPKVRCPGMLILSGERRFPFLFLGWSDKPM